MYTWNNQTTYNTGQNDSKNNTKYYELSLDSLFSRLPESL